MKKVGVSPVELTADRKKMIQMQNLSMMTDEILRYQFLAANAPRVQPAEVERLFADLVDNLRTQGKTLSDFCRDNATTEPDIRKDLTARLQWSAYGNARLTEADLQKYYLENKDFFDGTMVRASHIVTCLVPGMPEAEKAKARAQLTELRNALLARKIDFAEAARKYSQCPSAAKGGDLDYFPRKFALEDSFARIAFALQVGQMSDIVETSYGLHLILVTDRKEGKPSDLMRIRDEVRQLCLEEMWQTYLPTLRKAAKIEINLP
jgi:PPIC-type PPIASE domain